MKNKRSTINSLISLLIISFLSIVSFTQVGVASNNMLKDSYKNASDKSELHKNASLDDLSLKSSITQYGITWTFEKPARVGRFVNGDYYIVGPTIIVSITPKPSNGRNGSCLNPSSTVEKTGFDSRIPHGRYDPKLFLAPPIVLKPGDSLLSSISVDKIGTVKPMLWRIEKSQLNPLRTVAVLTCLEAPVPSDAFRPAYSDKKHRIYLARNLKRSLLPRLSAADISFKYYQGYNDQEFGIKDTSLWFQRPWIDLIMDQFGAPIENMPVYGAQFARAIGIASLLLCMDFTREEKEPLLINLVQVGIDLWGIAGQGSQPLSWSALGGHANGRKWPIIFAGMLLGDSEMQKPNKTYPYLNFSEDTQTIFGDSWTGAKVVWAGHMGKNGHPKYPDRGAYEHLLPEKWEGDTGENYRRCCTSNTWVGEALAARILHAEKFWDHDAFFAYVDRWMTEDDSKLIKIIKDARGKDYSVNWARQGSTWDPFVTDMWRKYRNHLLPGPDGTMTPNAENTWN
jgi:hypothetical protein